MRHFFLMHPYYSITNSYLPLWQMCLLDLEIDLLIYTNFSIVNSGLEHQTVNPKMSLTKVFNIASYKRIIVKL